MLDHRRGSKISPASDPLSRKAHQHRQAMCLGMHTSMVIASGGLGQRLAANGEEMQSERDFRVPSWSLSVYAQCFCAST